VALAFFGLARAESVSVDFNDAGLGSDPSQFASAVGAWSVTLDGDNKVYLVDGGKWSQGQPAAGLADKARSLYGERYAEFLDNVQAYAFFPLTVEKTVADFRSGEISVRFKPLRGRIDQGAGIVFNLQPNSDYVVLRANALEDNLVLFKYERGRRSSLKWIGNTPTASNQWHELKLVVQGRRIEGYLDGKRYLEHSLAAPPTGRIGLWSKADSVVLFDDFRVQTE
jgi:hypothetical protein